MNVFPISYESVSFFTRSSPYHVSLLRLVDALANFDGGHRAVEGATATAGIWATYPQTYVSTWTGLGDQVSVHVT